MTTVQKISNFEDILNECNNLSSAWTALGIANKTGKSEHSVNEALDYAEDQGWVVPTHGTYLSYTISAKGRQEFTKKFGQCRV